MATRKKSQSGQTERGIGLQKPAYLDNFLTLAFDAIIAYNSQRQITFWNPAAEKIYGWTAGEVLGKRPTELFWPVVDTPQAQEELKKRQRKLEEGETIQGEYKPRRRDGSSLWVEYSARAILDEAGDLLGYVAVYRDITERKQAEEDIRRLNAGLQAQLDEMKALLNVLPTGIWIGNEDCSVITGNRAAYEMLGLEREINASLTNPELQTRIGLRIFLNGQEVSPENAPMQQVARRGEPLYNLEHEFLFADETRKAVHANIVPLFDNERKIRKVIGAYTDLTQHKQMQNEIRLTSRMSAENPNPVMRLTIDGKVLYANAASTPLLEGRTQQMDQTVPHELQTLVADALTTGLKKEIEIEHQGRTFFCTLVPIPDAGCVNLYGSDITDRKRAEESLRISEDRLRLAVVAGNIGIWDIDLIRYERTWSKEGKAIYGLGPDEFLDFERQLALTHPDDRALVEGMVIAFRDLGSLKQLNFEHRIIRPDGSLCWVEVHGEALYDKGPLPVRLIGTIVDITERKRTEQALRESEQHFRTLANAIPSLVWTAGPDGKITYTNDQWLRYVGLDPEENATQWLERVLHPDDYERYVREWTRALGTVPDEFLIEVRYSRHDGQYRWFQTRAVPERDASGKVTAWYGVTTDIHERIEAEQRLMVMAEISELLRNFEDPGELLYSVSKVIGEHLQVKRCLFNEIDLEADLEIVHRDYCRGVPSVAGVHKVSEYSSITTDEIATGKTIINTDSKIDVRTARDYERSYEPNGERAYIAVPMMRDHRWVASLWVSDDTPRQWSKEEVSLLETIAERTWLAIEKLRINIALRDSEERLRVTFDTAVVGFATLALDTRFIEVNDAFCRIVGYSREELLQMDCSALTHSDYLESTANHVMQLITGEIPSFVLEKPYIRKDGKAIWVQNSVSLLRGADNKPLHLIAICQNITERKSAEEALRQSEAKLAIELADTKQLQTISSLLIQEDNINLLYEQILNAAIAVMHSDMGSMQMLYPEKNELSLLVWKGFDPASAAFWEWVRVDSNSTCGEALRTSERVIVPDVETCDFMAGSADLDSYRLSGIRAVQTTPLVSRRGRIVGMLSTHWCQSHQPTERDLRLLDVLARQAADLIERKSTEEALRSSEALYRTIARSIPGGSVYVVDKDLRYIVAEGPVTEAFGLSQKMLEGRTVSEVFAGEQAARMADRLKRNFEGETTNYETKHNGRVYWTQQAPLLDSLGHAIIITLDITERKNAEDALREHERQLQVLNETLEQKVKERTAEVRNLASELTKAEQRERHRISHILHDDLQQRVYAIQMQLAFLYDGLQIENEIARKELSDIKDQLDEILEVTRHLSIDLSPPILRNEGLTHAISWLAAQMREQYGLHIKLQAKGSFAIADEDLQVLLFNCVRELLFNIVKHAGVNQAVVALDWSTAGLRIEVKDEGKGFQINAPKQQVSANVEAGLRSSFGLPTIRHQLSLFGGQMDIKSDLGAGTRIILTIPLYEDGLETEEPTGS